MTLAIVGEALVVGDRALADFRGALTGGRAFEMLDAAHGRLLVQLPVGAGKTRWLQEIILHAMATPGQYDLVVVLAPRRDILAEIIARLPAELSPLLLTPRPHAQCGSLDPQWRNYEKHACGFLGREVLCGGCQHRSNCAWPKQYGSALEGQRLILGTQQHIVNNPEFIEYLRQQTRALRPLVLLDESNLLLRDGSVMITRDDLSMFIAAQEKAELPEGTRRVAAEWLDLSRLLLQAQTRDLHGTWRFPFIVPQWALEIQKVGRQLAPEQFRFLAYDLHRFCHSDRSSRERTSTGDLRFAGPPHVGNEFIVFTGSMSTDLARYRLDPNHGMPAISSPFASYRFEHPHTRWFNIASIAGAAKYFPKNAPAILEFFARIVTRNIRAGRRTLLVARKKFFDRCQAYLEPRLSELVGVKVRLVINNWDQHDLGDPHVVPMINYGVAGVNRFEHFDAAYCLTGYYVTAAVVARAAQDVDPESHRLPIKIRVGGVPRRRLAIVEHINAIDTILPAVAQGLLDQLEPEIIIQAVGRVRPFTRSREVITFHVGQLPGVRFTQEFLTIGGARAYFDVATRRTAERDRRAARACRLKADRKTNQEIATIMDISLSTVKRYIRTIGGHQAS